MSYPVVCLFEESSGNKIFMIPTKSSLLGFSRTIEGSEEKKLEFASDAFLSCITTEKEYDNGVFSIHVMHTLSLGKAIQSFECKTLMSPSDYDTYMVMNDTPICELDEVDIFTIQDMVEINQMEKAIKPNFH